MCKVWGPLLSVASVPSLPGRVSLLQSALTTCKSLSSGQVPGWLPPGPQSSPLPGGDSWAHYSLGGLSFNSLIARRGAQCMFLEYTQSCKTDWLHWEILYFLRNCFISKLSKLRGWGDGLVGKVLADRAWGPESGSQNPRGRLDRGLCLGAGIQTQVDRGDPWSSLADQSSW